MSRIPNVSRGTEEAIARIRSASGRSISGRDLILIVVPEVEHRVDALIRDKIHKSGANKNRVSSYFINKNLDDSLQTWVGRNAVLSNLFDCNVKGKTPGQRFELLVEIRNSLVHGNGALTLKQSKNMKSVIGLKKKLFNEFSIVLHGTRIMMESVDHKVIGDVASAYLSEIDAVLRGPESGSSGIRV